MVKLTDDDRLRAYRDALSNWPYTGFVEFELTETAYKWLRRELEGITTRDLSRLMWEYVEGGGVVDEVRETRPEWSHYEFHYDLRFVVQGRAVYVETRLFYEPPFKPDNSVIFVVNVHAP